MSSESVPPSNVPPSAIKAMNNTQMEYNQTLNRIFTRVMDHLDDVQRKNKWQFLKKLNALNKKNSSNFVKAYNKPTILRAPKKSKKKKSIKKK